MAQSSSATSSEVVCLIGRSGSGKSTFPCCVNHLEKIDGDRLHVDGKLVGYRQKNGKVSERRENDVTWKRAEIGMVFQRFNLFQQRESEDRVASMDGGAIVDQGPGEAGDDKPREEGT